IHRPERRELLRDDARVIAEGRREHRGAEQHARGRLARGAEPRQGGGRMAALVHPRLQVITEEHGVEAVLLRADGVVEQFARPELLARGFVSETDGHENAPSSRCRNSATVPGHSRASAPLRSSTYQLWHPPVSHGVRAARWAMSAVEARSASGVTRTVMPRAMSRAAKAACASEMRIDELWPSEAFGPLSTNRFGKPDTSVEATAVMPPDQWASSVSVSPVTSAAYG